MLGEAQLAWLKAALAVSTATWKIVSTDVPLSIPTGSRPEQLGRDAFAGGASPAGSSGTGFERELLDLLAHLDREEVANVVFIATDVHFASQFRYEQDFDGDDDFVDVSQGTPDDEKHFFQHRVITLCAPTFEGKRFRTTI